MNEIPWPAFCSPLHVREARPVGGEFRSIAVTIIYPRASVNTNLRCKFTIQSIGLASRPAVLSVLDDRNRFSQFHKNKKMAQQPLDEELSG